MRLCGLNGHGVIGCSIFAGIINGIVLSVIGARSEEKNRAGHATAGSGLGVVAVVEPDFIARLPIISHSARCAIIVD